jgi:hypothetical protein
MTDVNKVHGPSGAPDNLGKKDKTAVDADKFREEMRKRVTEVSQVDPDEQKKRKRQEEAEEEEAAASQAGPATPQALVTPFSLEQEKKKASPLDLQKEGTGISPIKPLQPTQTQPPHVPKATFFQAPSTDEMSGDSGTLEEESLSINASAPDKEPAAPTVSSQAQTTPAYPQAQQQQTQATPPEETPISPSPPESRRQQGEDPTQKQKSRHEVVSPFKEKKSAPPGMASKIEPPLKEEEQKEAELTEMGTIPSKAALGLTAADLREVQPTKAQDTSALCEQRGKKREGRERKDTLGTKSAKEAAEEAIEGAGMPTPPSTFEKELESQENKRVESKEKPSQEQMTGLPTMQTEAQLKAPSLAAPEAFPSYPNISPQLQELFDRMVGVMTVMNMSGITETVITLNSPQFASSVFFGTQIIIQEFSTAPQAFNIQLNGEPQAVALFQGSADDLMAAFQAGNYNFRVNRLETGYLADRPLFKRKEKASGENQGQTGDSPS